jgi:single-strand DNA-binding protein
MAGVNKVILVGHLGKDPEIRTFESGQKKASFSLATTEAYKDKNGNRVEQTEWHNIVCWRNLADIAEQYLNKGKLIFVEGRLRTRSWEENGTKRYITEIEASNFIMLGAKQDANRIETQLNSPAGISEKTSMPSVPEAVTTQDVFPEEGADDLPF